MFSTLAKLGCLSSNSKSCWDSTWASREGGRGEWWQRLKIERPQLCNVELLAPDISPGNYGSTEHSFTEYLFCRAEQKQTGNIKLSSSPARHVVSRDWKYNTETPFCRRYGGINKNYRGNARPLPDRNCFTIGFTRCWLSQVFRSIDKKLHPIPLADWNIFN